MQVTWLKQPSSVNYREELKKLTRLALAREIRQVLFDIRKRCYISISDQNWVVRHVLPLFIGKDLRFAYLVNMQNVELMDSLRLQQIIAQSHELKGRFTVELFLNLEEAQRWLLDKETALSHHRQ